MRSRRARRGSAARTCTLALAALASTLALEAGAADVPLVLHYQGQLLDAAGDPVHGMASVDVGVWQSATSPLAADRLYFEQQAGVPVDDGVFRVEVGLCSRMPLPGACAGAPSGSFDAGLFAGADRWLEIAVDGETLAPRRKFASVPYALRAEAAATAETAALAQTAENLDVSSAPGILMGDPGTSSAMGLVWDLEAPNPVRAILGAARGGDRFMQPEWIAGLQYNDARAGDPTEHGFLKVVESGYVAVGICHGGALAGQSCSPTGPPRSAIFADDCRDAGGVCHPLAPEYVEPNFNLYPVDYVFSPANVSGSFEPGEEIVFDDSTHPAADDGARAMIVGRCVDAGGTPTGEECRSSYLPGSVCIGGTHHGLVCAPSGAPEAQVTVAACEGAASPGECVPGNVATSLCASGETCAALVDDPGCGSACSMQIRQKATGGYTNEGLITVVAHALAGDPFRGVSSGAGAEAAPVTPVVTVHRSEAHKWRPGTSQMSWSFRPDPARPPIVKLGPNGEFCVGGDGSACLNAFELQNGTAKLGHDFTEPGSRVSTALLANWRSARDGSTLGNWSQLRLNGRIAPEGDAQRVTQAFGVDMDFGFDDSAGPSDVEIGSLHGIHLTAQLGDGGLASFGEWSGIRLAAPGGSNQPTRHAALVVEDQRAKGVASGDAIRIEAQTPHPSRGNLHLVGGGHDSGHLRLGSGHVWWDQTSEALRVRDGAPTSESNCCAVVTGSGSNAHGPAAWAKAGTSGSEACGALKLTCIDAWEPGGAQVGCGDAAAFRFVACR